jgi:uncharacterized membrane protein YeiH
MVFKSLEKNFKVTLFIFDSFGLGLFTIIGIQKGLNAGIHPLICIGLEPLLDVSEELSGIFYSTEFH